MDVKEQMAVNDGRDGTDNKKAGRQVHLDLLRILACFSVVMLHSAAQFWYVIPVTERDWMIANSYDSVFRFGVPIFVMISGALFLQSGKEISVKRLYTHNILRLVIIYLVWSCLYGLFDCRGFEWSVLDKGDVFREIFAGRYHLWYLPMIVGIYMLLPILKKWVNAAEKKELEYFLALFLIFQVGRSTFLALKNNAFTNFVWGVATPEMVCGYIGYFVLGYYIVRYGIAPKWHKWIYLGGAVSVPANIVLGNLLAIRAGEPVAAIYDSFGAFTFLIVLALFVFFTNVMSVRKYSPKVCKLVKELSMGTLGVYLMHIMVIEALEPYGFHSMMFAPAVCIPVYCVCVFVLCYLAAAVLRRIPFVGKYIC